MFCWEQWGGITWHDASVQDLRGSYTLGPVTESVFSNVTQIISNLVARTDSAENYLSYGSVHPLYIEVKALVSTHPFLL